MTDSARKERLNQFFGSKSESSTLNWTNSMRIDIVNLRK
ncbi:abi-like family protein [Staphylococcus aureus]|nr:abi-like family protein [Staphylococcus aureus]